MRAAPGGERIRVFWCTACSCAPPATGGNAGKEQQGNLKYCSPGPSQLIKRTYRHENTLKWAKRRKVKEINNLPGAEPDEAGAATPGASRAGQAPPRCRGRGATRRNTGACVPAVPFPAGKREKGRYPACSTQRGKIPGRWHHVCGQGAGAVLCWLLSCGPAGRLGSARAWRGSSVPDQGAPRESLSQTSSGCLWRCLREVGVGGWQ